MSVDVEGSSINDAKTYYITPKYISNTELKK